MVALNTGDPQRALELITEKEDICRKNNLSSGLANALVNKAETLISLHRTKDALRFAEEANRLCMQHGLDQIARQLKPLLEKLQSEA